MKTKIFGQFAMAILVAALSTACSDPKDKLPAPTPPPIKKLSDENFGEWITECMEYPIGHRVFYTVGMTISADQMTHEQRFFRDAECTVEKEEDRKTKQGAYKVSTVLADGRNVIELSVPIGDNITQNWDFNLKRDGESLWLSEFFNAVFDKAEAVSVKYQLSKVVQDDDSGKDGNDKDKDKDEEEKPAAVLESGIYNAISGDSDICPQQANVAINRETGKVMEIWLSYQPPCYLVTRPYQCNEAGVCTYDGKTLTILSETTYYWESPAEDLSATFEKQ